jgi:hypothetical protein
MYVYAALFPFNALAIDTAVAYCALWLVNEGKTYS